MSTILDVAGAIVASLNAGSFSMPFVAQRLYRPVFELPDMQTLRVSVVPKSLEISTATRARGFFDCVIDIGVQKKIAGNDEVDMLMALVEQIADHLRTSPLDGAPNAVFVSVVNDPIFAPEHLEQWRQFTSVLTTTYRVMR